MKAISEEALTAFNKHSFAFESRLIERKEDRVSQLLLELCERAVLGDVPASVRVDALGRDLVLRVGPSKQPPGHPAWAVESTNGFDAVLDMFGPEDVVLIFLCILHEISLVFVSESMRCVTSAV
jgi:hypothetical protein